MNMGNGMVVEDADEDLIFFSDGTQRGMAGRGGRIEKIILRKMVEEIERERALRRSVD